MNKIRISQIIGLLIISAQAEIQPEHTIYPLEQILAIADSNAVQLQIIDTKTKAGYAEVAMYRANAMPYITFGTGVSRVSQSYETQKMQQMMMAPLFGGSGEETIALLGLFGLIDTLNPMDSARLAGYRHYTDSLSDNLNLPDRINGYSFNWALNVKQPLVTFGKISSAIRLAHMRESTLENMQKLEKDLFFLRVIQEFSAAYLAQLDVAINKSSLDRSLQLQIRLKTDFKAGRTTRREVLRIEALVQGDRAQLVASEGTSHTLLKRLLQTINSSDTSQISLSLDEYSPLSLAPPPSGPGNIQLSLKKNEVAMYKEQVRYIRSSFFPSIDLVAGINNQFMTIDTSGLVADFMPEGTESSDFATLAEAFDESNPKPYKMFDPAYFNFSIGFQLNWTLFDGFRTRSQYRQAKYKAQLAQMELEEMDKEQRIAIEEANNQIATIDSTLKAVILQQEASRIALEQTESDYSDGMTDFSTLLDTDKENRAVIRQLNGLKIQRVLALTQLRIAIGLPVYGENK